MLLKKLKLSYKFSSEYHEFFLGVKNTIPLMVGVIPFGLACGIMAFRSGLSPLEATSMSLLVFAGSAQFIAIDMLHSGAGMLMIVFSTFLINLRHLLMGLSLSEYLSKQKDSRLYALAFGLTDEAYASTITHYHTNDSKDGNPLFLLGSSIGLYIFWVLSTLFGALLGNYIGDPIAWGLDFTMTATFLSILVPQVRNLRMFVIVLISGSTALAAYMFIPGKWYIIIATICAVILGTILESLQKGRCTSCVSNSSY